MGVGGGGARNVQRAPIYIPILDPMGNGLVKMKDINDPSISGTTSGQASGPVNISTYPSLKQIYKCPQFID